MSNNFYIRTKVSLLMSAAAKTLELLSYFSTERPEIGLSQLCRLAGRDKATTYRHLQDLEATGFVEQDQHSKLYRLGPIVLQLARTREATVPRKLAVQPALLALAAATGETSHVSILSGTTVYALASCESPQHSTRAIIDLKTFPLHATASGLCAVAFGPDEIFDKACEDLQSFTPNTPKTADDLTRMVQTIRATGFGRSNQSFEIEIHGMSAPLFDQSDLFAGAVSVASVASRFTPELEGIVQRGLVTSSREITKQWGGTVPAKIEALWANTLSQATALEPTS